MNDTQDHPSGFGLARCADGGVALPPRAAPGTAASRVLAAFVLTTEVEALIDSCLAELRHVIPQLRPWRGRISGRRVLGAHSQAEHGSSARRGVVRGFTRLDLEFEVECDPAAPDVVVLACHATVRGRDLPTTHTRIPLPANDPGHAARQRITAWVEDALLAFATEWFRVRLVEHELTS